MDFNPSDDQRAIREMARAFAAAELAPHSARWDEEKFFPSTSCAGRRRWVSPASM
jgi:alkylation response protein AidB-like acyl-CoA dehydrogenase